MDGTEIRRPVSVPHPCPSPRRGGEFAAVIGAGRIGRQIALAFALGGWQVQLRDVKDRSRADADAVLADARREI